MHIRECQTAQKKGAAQPLSFFKGIITLYILGGQPRDVLLAVKYYNTIVSDYLTLNKYYGILILDILEYKFQEN